MEHESGALHALQDYLNTTAYRTETTSKGGQGRAPIRSIPSHISDRYSAQVSSSDSGDITAQRLGEDIELGESASRTDLGETLHLLYCIEKGRYTIDLHHELITNVPDDRTLFRTLRHIYHQNKGKLRPYWSLRTVNSIHFMKVCKDSQ